MSKYYHATDTDGFSKILKSGEIKTGIDGIIYMTTSPEDAVKFISVRCINPIYVFEFEVPNPELVEEQFDHSFTFFKCKSYGYPENITIDKDTKAYKYKL